MNIGIHRGSFIAHRQGETGPWCMGVHVLFPSEINMLVFQIPENEMLILQGWKGSA